MAINFSYFGALGNMQQWVVNHLHFGNKENQQKRAKRFADDGAASIFDFIDVLLVTTRNLYPARVG